MPPNLVFEKRAGSDASTGEQIPTQGFLRAERALLESRGWQYNPWTGAYHPPGP